MCGICSGAVLHRAKLRGRLPRTPRILPHDGHVEREMRPPSPPLPTDADRLLGRIRHNSSRGPNRQRARVDQACSRRVSTRCMFMVPSRPSRRDKAGVEDNLWASPSPAPMRARRSSYRAGASILLRIIGGQSLRQDPAH